MATTTVRVSEETKRKLAAEAKARGISLAEALDLVVEEARRRRRLEDINRGYAIMREDREDWDEELARRADWQAVLSDGLPQEARGPE